jgi:glycosyltransferase involved in cell wall biosynthesis
MNIVHVLQSVSEGAEAEHAARLAIATARRGDSVTVFSLAAGQASSTGDIRLELRDANVTLRDLNVAGRVRAALRLAGWFARLRPDIVHTHADTLPVGWAAARMLSPVRGPRIVHTVGERDWGQLAALPRALREALKSRIELVAVSDAAAEVVAREVGARPRHVIPYGIPVAAYRMSEEERASERAALGLRRNQVAFLTVVGPDGANSSALTLDAFARPGMGPARLLIAGAGAIRTQLEAQARGLDVQGRVDFWDGTQALPRLLGAVDALVHPSGSRVVLQAMAAGLPVIAARSASWVSEATGLLFAPDDAASLSAAMKRLAQDRTLARRLGGEGARIAAERFDAATVAQSYAHVYAAACGKR